MTDGDKRTKLKSDLAKEKRGKMRRKMENEGNGEENREGKNILNGNTKGKKQNKREVWMSEGGCG